MAVISALLVEDDLPTRLIIEARLQAIGFAVTSVESGTAALRMLHVQRFDLLVTDLVLDDLDGVAILRTAMAIDPSLRVIILTARATLDSAINAVNSGAVAYILKPALHGELERHALAAVAKSSPVRQQPTYQQLAESSAPAYTPVNNLLCIGPLQIEMRRHSASLNGRPITLTAGEFALLAYLANHADEVQPIPTIAKAIFDYPCSPQEARELIKARVHKLRQKLESEPGSFRMVHCVRGAGYVLSANR